MKELFGKKYLYFWIVLAISFIGILAWQLVCPKYLDDYPYSLLSFKNSTYTNEAFWNSRGAEATSFNDLFDGMWDHYSQFNSRLSNMLFILVNMLPLKIVKLLCGLAIIGTFIGIIYYSLGKNGLKRWWLIVIGVLSFWIMFPWSEHMPSGDLVFNYPVAACFIIGWLFVYRKINTFSINQKVIFWVYTFIMSLYHEGFTIPLGCYLFMDIVLNHRHSKLRWMALIIMIFSVIWMVVFGLGSRLARNGISFNWSFLFQIRGIEMIIDFCPSIFALGCMIFAKIFSKRINKDIFKKEFYPYSAAILSSLLIYIFIYSAPRALWCGDMFSIIMVLRILYLSFQSKTDKPVFIYLGYAFVLVYAWWLFELVWWQKKAVDDDRKIVEIVSPRRSYPWNIVYEDKLQFKDVPWYLLNIPVPLYENGCIDFFATYWLKEGFKEVIVLPERYEGKDFEELPLIAGNAGVRGQWPYLLIDRPYNGRLKVICGDFEDNSNPFIPFISDIRKFVAGYSSNEFYPIYEPEEIQGPFSRKIYGGKVAPLPRTFQWRTIVAVDTLENNYSVIK